MRRFVVSLALLAATACAHGGPPPYAPGEPPAPDALLAAAAPALGSLQVPRARIREVGQPGAGLELVAQAPNRFAGKIHIAGNEVVQLAVNEMRYALRLVDDRRGSLPAGFYSGPPSDCAVDRLIGVPLRPEALTSLLLGGAPLVEGPHEVLGQKWIRREEVERLEVQSPSHRQRIDYAWIDGAWHFAATEVLDRASGQALWSIRHVRLKSRDGAVLPTKTIIGRHDPNARGGSVELAISFQETIVDPFAGLEVPAENGAEWDDWDDEGWETGDEAGDESGDPAGSDENSAPKPGPAAPIPAAFVLEAAGLPERGDLCKGG